MQEALLQRSFRDFAQVCLFAYILFQKHQQFDAIDVQHGNNMVMHCFNGCVTHIVITQVMRGYFPSILALAQSLLRSPDPCMVPFGGQMYHHLFTAFDSYCQQVGLARLLVLCKNVTLVVLMLSSSFLLFS